MVTKAKKHPTENLPLVTELEDGSFTIKLKRPIMHGDDECIEVLHLREPEAGDLEEIDFTAGIKMRDILKIGGTIAKQPPSVMKKLKMADTMALVGVVNDFLPGSEIGSQS